MDQDEYKEDLFNAFVAGNEHGQPNNLKNSFDQWLIKNIDLYCKSHKPLIPHKHTELCKCNRPNYFDVGDSKNGCTCTGIINRFLTTQELLNIVEAIPDEKIAMQNWKGNMNEETNKYNNEIKDAYWIIDHIIIFRGDTHINCPEVKWIEGSLITRIEKFKKYNSSIGSVIKQIESKKDPNYQQETQKKRIIALFKDMLNKNL